MPTKAIWLRLSGTMSGGVLCLVGSLSCSSGGSSQDDKGTGLVVTPKEEQRAELVEPVFGTGTELPPVVDLAQWLPPAGNQGTQSSCVGFALGYGLKTFHEAREHGWDANLVSRQFSPSYIFDRINLGCDVGASIKDGLDLLINEGCPTIRLAPYDPDSCSAQTAAIFSEKDRYKIRSYKLIAFKDIETVKALLASGAPVVLGLRVFDRWFQLSAEDPFYDAAIGGEPRNHVVLAVGYDDDLHAVKVFNSYGAGWGDDGFGWIDYDLWQRVVKIGYVTEDEETDALLSFGAPLIFDVGLNPFRLDVGDVDGDGDLDALALSFTEESFTVLMNDGAGAFRASTTRAVGDGPFALALGDVDNDGDLDVAVANLYSSDVSISLNNGQGVFGDASTYEIEGGFLGDVALADFDGDQYLDVAAVNFSRVEIDTDISVLMNNGDGTLAAPVRFGGGSAGRSLVTVGDFDEDGDQDLVTVNGLSNDISVFMNDGNGSFSEGSNYAHEGGFPYASTTADIDNDNDLDLIVLNSLSNRLSVLENDGAGNFTELASYAVGGDRPFDVATGDFDGDGHVDIAAANADSNDLAVLRNSGEGTFAAPIIFGVGGLEPTGVAAGDLDNDGDADLLIMNNALTDGSVLLNPLLP